MDSRLPPRTIPTRSNQRKMETNIVSLTVDVSMPFEVSALQLHFEM